MASFPFTAPGPFDRITAIRFPGALFRLRLLRDDGLLYIPGGPALEIRLTTPEDEWVFTGFTDNLDYQEAVAGLVTAFGFQDGHYRLELDRTRIRDRFGLTGSAVRFLLTTDGVGTLETRYPRRYTGGEAGTAIGPGSREVTLPCWLVSTAITYPSAVATTLATTVRSSIPYGLAYGIENGNALGRFQLPVVGISWQPKADLSGWTGLLDVDDVCPQGSIVIPGQVVPGIVPPAQPPSGPEDRAYTLHYNGVLEVALSACPAAWSETAVSVGSSFGYDGVIPYSNAAQPPFAADFPLADQTPDISGRTFQRTYAFQWDAGAFQYDTGEWPDLHLDQTAVRIQSPAVGFDRFTVTPLPE